MVNFFEKAFFFFQLTYHGVRADFRYAGDISDTAATETVVVLNWTFCEIYAIQADIL